MGAAPLPGYIESTRVAALWSVPSPLVGEGQGEGGDSRAAFL